MAPAKSKRGRKSSTKDVPNAVDGKAVVKKKSHAKKSFSSFSIYIYKVLKQVHPDTGKSFSFYFKQINI